MEHRKQLLIIGLVILLIVLLLWYLKEVGFFGAIGTPGLRLK